MTFSYAFYTPFITSYYSSFKLNNILFSISLYYTLILLYSYTLILLYSCVLFIQIHTTTTFCVHYITELVGINLSIMETRHLV